MTPAPALTSAQEELLTLASAGSSSASAAKETGIHRNSVFYWLRTSDAFREAYQQAQYLCAMQMREEAQRRVPLAFAMIEQVLKSPESPNALRLKAALSLVDRASTRLPAFPGHEPPSQPIVLEIRTHKSAQISTGSESADLPAPGPPLPIE